MAHDTVETGENGEGARGGDRPPRDYGTLTVSWPEPGVAVLTLNRPERLNALNFAMVDGLYAALDDIDADNACSVVILTGAGRGFCSGLDLKEVGPSSRSGGLSGPHASLRGQAHIAGLVPRLRRLQQPVIAAVNGPAYGGGMALACACDIRLATPAARWCVQFIKVGVSGCDIGISYNLPRIIGVARAHELILTARTVEAEEAERIGLISRVVPDNHLMVESLAVARTIASYSPFAVTLTKQVMWDNVDAPDVDSAIHLENRNQVLAASTGNLAEAAAAFAEGRDPVWG
jgi:enoyl-CoA hydratase/carnithine racemase